MTPADKRKLDRLIKIEAMNKFRGLLQESDLEEAAASAPLANDLVRMLARAIADLEELAVALDNPFGEGNAKRLICGYKDLGNKRLGEVTLDGLIDDIAQAGLAICNDRKTKE